MRKKKVNIRISINSSFKHNRSPNSATNLSKDSAVLMMALGWPKQKQLRRTKKRGKKSTGCSSRSLIVSLIALQLAKTVFLTFAYWQKLAETHSLLAV